MFIVVGYNIALFFLLIFTCTPYKRNWDITITEGSCIDRTPLYMATAVLNMLTDMLLLILPIPMALKLQVPGAQKAGLLCIFGVGSLLVSTLLFLQKCKADDSVKEPALQVVSALRYYSPCLTPSTRHGLLSCQESGCE